MTLYHEDRESLQCRESLVASRSSRDDDDFGSGLAREQELDAVEDAETFRQSQLEVYNSDEDDDCSTTITLFHAGYNMASVPVCTQEYTRPALAQNAHAIRETFVDRPLATAYGCSTRLPSTDQSALEKQPTIEPILDPDLVTWEEQDPDFPHNWPAHRRWISTIIIAMYAFIAPMASTMVAPALGTISDEFNLQTSVDEFLVMSIFLLAFAIGPFLWGPLSEVFGRVRVMQSANMIFLLFNTVCGFAKTKEQMMAFRFLSGIGGSAAQAIGGGILSDCFRAGERGLATAIYSLMPFLSPALAPIMGGYMTQYISWRWVFWTTSIFDGVVQVVSFVLLRETHHPTILKKKAMALRKSTGNSDLHTKWEGPDHSMKKILMKSLVRPFIMLTTQPALQAMSLFRGFQYGIMYLVFSTIPRVFEGSYDQDVGRASLNYLSLGIGFVIGLQISGRMQDKIYKWCKEHAVDPSSLKKTRQYLKVYRNEDAENEQQRVLPLGSDDRSPRSSQHTIPRKPVPQEEASVRRRGSTRSNFDPTRGLPEYRLPLVLPFSLLLPIGLFLYGWTAEYNVHWFAPNLGLCILSIGLIVCFNCAQGYVVDTYTTYAASATGAAAFVRTMAGFSFPLFAPTMYDKFGVGWGNSILAFIALTLGMAAPVLLWRYGQWLRSKSTYCVG
ncbi:related to multidrug resistant protein [Ramularia collo-cygni]|uniref:Cercosporin MFS transporter CTB4 n=1 Tax=Ramularia collo-cygni TaxID=112498 RepID=A0A2D3ULD0_9PEZI|nr:related to multidrug resistant protein [Ramularia collo-cygni]CZT14532.1 related to multidrug resistant protein [Ramularia collo-cygni]